MILQNSSINQTNEDTIKNDTQPILIDSSNLDDVKNQTQSQQDNQNLKSRRALKASILNNDKKRSKNKVSK